MAQEGRKVSLSRGSGGAGFSGRISSGHGSLRFGLVRQQTTLADVIPSLGNPYARVAVAEQDELDGIDLGFVSPGDEDEDDGSGANPITTREQGGPSGDGPSKSLIYALFEEYLDVMSPLSDVEEADLRMMTIEEKWKIIFNQKTRTPVVPADTYITELRKLTNHDKSKAGASPKKSAKNSSLSLSSLLRKLKVDLKMSHESFVTELIQEPSNGMELLVSVLKDIHQEQTSKQAGRKAKHEQHKKTLTEEFDCLLCLKFACRGLMGLTQLIRTASALATVSMCLMSSHCKARIIALELLTLACELPEGYYQTMEALTCLRLKFGESVRFKMLVGMLNSHSGMIATRFQAACLRFFNKLLSATEGADAKVYIQHELELAGFDAEQLEKRAVGETSSHDDLQFELELWKKNYVDVQTTTAELAAIQSRNSILRQEVDLLQDRIKELEKMQVVWEKKLQENADKCEDYRERAAALQDAVDKLQTVFRERTGDEVDKEVKLADVMKPLDVPVLAEEIRFASIKTTTSTSSGSGGDPEKPDPPPIPPAPPVGFRTLNKQKKVLPRVSLPMLNWTPLHRVDHTMFMNIDDEAVFREVNFADFEAKFQLKCRQESTYSKQRREKALRKVSQQIRFIENTRARNMIITKRRIGYPSREIGEFVNRCDTAHIPGEYAQLLLKFVPSKEELKLLAQHAHNYRNMAEAEQLMFELAQVQRVDSKLSVMAFMGTFEEVLSTTTPQIECILRASHSVAGCRKLQRIFEVILAFGNYLNSCKRGYASGFRLESLQKLQHVVSVDKSQTLLDYIVEVIETSYPDLVDFYEELIDIQVKKGVSYQALLSEVLALRKGMDILRFEKEKQEDNDILNNFYTFAHGKVQEVVDSFKEMEESYKDVCQMFGEQHKSTEPDEFFKIFANFADKFREAVEKSHRRRVSIGPPPKGGAVNVKVVEAVEAAAKKLELKAKNRSPDRKSTSPDRKSGSPDKESRSSDRKSRSPENVTGVNFNSSPKTTKQNEKFVEIYQMNIVNELNNHNIIKNKHKNHFETGNTKAYVTNIVNSFENPVNAKNCNSVMSGRHAVSDDARDSTQTVLNNPNWVMRTSSSPREQGLSDSDSGRHSPDSNDSSKGKENKLESENAPIGEFLDDIPLPDNSPNWPRPSKWKTFVNLYKASPSSPVIPTPDYSGPNTPNGTISPGEKRQIDQALATLDKIVNQNMDVDKLCDVSEAAPQTGTKTTKKGIKKGKEKGKEQKGSVGLQVPYPYRHSHNREEDIPDIQDTRL